MDEIELFRRLGLALAIGLLLGVERGWRARETPSGVRVAGVRTFALTGLLGGFSGWLALAAGPILPALIFAGFAALIVVSYGVSARRDGDLGITTEIALLLAFALGAAATLGAMALAAAGAVAAAALLALKATLHGWIEHIRRLELNAAIQLAVLSVVLLPLLPDRGLGPFGALNPHALWLAVVLVAGLSFLGHVAIRAAGPGLGVLITGLLGGLASSTATTLAFARLARGDAALTPALAVGAALAGSVTFLRMLVVASAFNAALAQALAVPLGAMAATGFAGALILRLAFARGAAGAADAAEAPEGENPLALAIALKFAVFLAAVAVGTAYLKQWFGAAGVYAAAAMAGVGDVDAVTISIARMTGADLGPCVAAGAVVLAVSINSVVKAGIALTVGGARLGLRVGLVYAATLAAGAAALWLA